MSALNYQPPIQAQSHRKGRRGFSAVELVAVSTIIAILSMILVQSLQNHVEKARLARVYTDLGEIRDIQSLIFAQTSRFARLQDLDNTEIYTTNTLAPDFDPGIQVPGLFYKMRIDDVKSTTLLNTGIPSATYERVRSVMSNKWTGPYTNFTEYITLGEIASDMDWLLSTNDGPIYYDTVGSEKDVDTDRYPLDPWGSPYIFVPRYHIDTAVGVDDVVIGGRVYSMGPDGFPGSNDGTSGDALSGADYFPEDLDSDGNLGEDGSDDIMFEF
jgi:prepilin-type N-terminal cleavage/methylation domain-containing protein